MTAPPPITFATRFRGFLPVVMDLETGGFNSKTDALLEIAAVLLEMRSDGTLARGETHRYHVIPFPGSNLEPASLAVTGIDPHHPLRPAISEEDALQRIFRDVRTAVRNAECTRAILVGHNASFDLNFLNAAVGRTQIKRNPFHPFSCFDTATLGGVAYGQTVLMRATLAAGLEWDTSSAHSAVLRCGALRGSVLRGLQSIPRRVRGEPTSPRGDGTSGSRSRAFLGAAGRCRPAGLGGDCARFRQELLQLAALVHLDRDIATADELAVDVELGERRPVGDRS